MRWAAAVGVFLGLCAGVAGSFGQARSGGEPVRVPPRAPGTQAASAGRPAVSGAASAPAEVVLNQISEGLSDQQQMRLRVLAAEKLMKQPGLLQSQRGVWLLNAALLDREVDVRLAAVTGLGGHPLTPEVVQRLIGMLKDPDDTVLRETAKQLGRARPLTPENVQAIVPLLVNLAARPSAHVEINKRGVFDLLRRRLLTEHPDLAHAAIVRAVRVRTDRPKVVWWLTEGDEDAREEAWLIVLELEAHEPDAQVREALGNAWYLMAPRGWPVVHPERVWAAGKGVLADATATGEARRHAEEMLQSLPPEQVDFSWLIEQANQGRGREVLPKIAAVLRRVPPTRYPEVLAGLGKMTPETRKLLTSDLPHDVWFSEALLEKMVEDPHPQVRLFALTGGKNGDFLRARLENLIQDRDPEVAETAMGLAVSLGGAQQVHALRLRCVRGDPLRGTAIRKLAAALQWNAPITWAAETRELEAVARAAIYDRDPEVRSAGRKMWQFLRPGEKLPPPPLTVASVAMLAVAVLMALGGAVATIWGLVAGAGRSPLAEDADGRDAALRVRRYAWAAAGLLIAACVILIVRCVVMAVVSPHGAIEALGSALAAVVSLAPVAGALAVWGWQVPRGVGAARVVCLGLAGLVLLNMLAGLGIDGWSLAERMLYGAETDDPALLFRLVLEGVLSVVCGLMLWELMLLGRLRRAMQAADLRRSGPATAGRGA